MVIINYLKNLIIHHYLILFINFLFFYIILIYFYNYLIYFITFKLILKFVQKFI